MVAFGTFIQKATAEGEFAPNGDADVMVAM